MPVSVLLLVTAAVALAAAVAVSALRRYRRVCRRLDAARASHRLTERRLCEDLEAFRARIEAAAADRAAAAADRAVVAEAGRIVDAALAHSFRSPIDPTSEGGQA